MKRWFVLLLCALCLLSACANEVILGEEKMRIVFFDAGNADAMLIKTPDTAVLVDTGLDKNGEDLVASIKALGVESLDVVFITHFDKDHVGGADHIFEHFPVAAVYQPDYHKDSKQYAQYINAMSAKGITPVTLFENAVLNIGLVQYEIDVANDDFYGADEENDFSLVIRLHTGNAFALLAGDAENPRLGELLVEGNLKSQLLKVPHHGKYEDLSQAFFEAVDMDYAVITSSDDEPEDYLTVTVLKKLGAEVFLTRQGTVSAITDGLTWRLSQA